MDFICRGNNRLVLRKRWLTIFGTEMQFLEMSQNRGNYSAGWTVFHSMDPFAAQSCYNGTVNIYSGVLWKNLLFRKGDTHTFGMEWTPSGYRIFIDGVRYNSGFLQEYGYPLDYNSGIYGYNATYMDTSGSIGRTVSHNTQTMSFLLDNTHVPLNHGLPADWKQELYLDYIRVYQPLDKYSGETKVYD